MDKVALKLVFEELLEEWESANEIVNHDRGLDVLADQDRIGAEKAKYLAKFNEALEG